MRACTVGASLLALLFAAGTASAQDYCPRDGFPERVVTELVQSAFVKLVTPLPTTGIGNFAQLKVADAELGATASWFVADRAFFGVKLKGGITEGLVSVFSSEKLSTKFGGGAEISYLVSDGSGLFDLEVCSNYYARVNKLRADSMTRVIEARGRMPLLHTIMAMSRLDSLSNALQVQLSSERSSVRTDSLNMAIQSLAVRREALRTDSVALARLEAEDAVDQVREWYIDQIERLRDSVSLAGYEVGWITVGYEASNRGFRLFTPTAPLDLQISKEAFLTHTAVVKYSRYRHDPGWASSYFWSIGGEVSITDNFASLDKVRVTDARAYGDTTTRTAKVEYDAYEGDYVAGQESARIFADYYRFFLTRNRAAAHLFPSHVMTDGERPVTNFGLGLLFDVLDADKPSGSAHIEVFINLKDVFDVQNSNVGRLKRSDVGLLITFPINFPATR